MRRREDPSEIADWPDTLRWFDRAEWPGDQATAVRAFYDARDDWLTGHPEVPSLGGLDEADWPDEPFDAETL